MSDGQDAEPDETPAAESPTLSLDRNFAEFIEEQRRLHVKKYEDFARRTEYPSRLAEAFGSYSALQKFQPGQLIQWKPLMKNRPMPAYGAPIVLIEYLSEPQAVDGDGDPLEEPRDIRIGLLNGDGNFAVYTYNSARFTLWAD
ncbi:hypothetical protein [Aeromicrobium sp. 9AM]|uniref:hypothetical protein n=1 Tax=Aeromicrobium sp. 9AM TaxID=2653126 RepID=UPI0012F1F8A9|nr:hypothetical protein [Aeromicrobium sp. 9AM]VXB34106.1 hypothetical protein AERO9AM_11041 [Aeromicrobium sp. 9AM]